MDLARQITNNEQSVIEYFLQKLDPPWKQSDVPSQVLLMKDGQMGSISFDLTREEKYGSDLIQGRYLDEDDIVVLITLSINQKNELFELEFWKTDFSKLRKYPRPEEITITSTNSTKKH